MVRAFSEARRLASVFLRQPLVNAALGGCLITLFTLNVSRAQDEQKQKPQADPPAQTQKYSTPPLSVTITNPVRIEREDTVEPAWDKPNCAKPQNHDEADLCEQRRMAKAAEDAVWLNKWQIFIGVVTILGLGATVYYTRETAKAALGATNVAKRALEDLERPFVYIATLTRGFSTLSDGHLAAARPLEYQCINLGRTPADLRELVAGVLEVDVNDFPPPVTPALGTERVLPPGSVVGPDQAVKFNVDLPNRFAPQTRGRNGIDTNVFFIGYVRYADIFGTRYVTGFCAIHDPASWEFVLRGDERYNYTRKES